MKKFFALILAAALTFCFCQTAFAKENKETVGENETAEISVSAKWVFTTRTPEVYSVDIAWSEMTFVYSGEETKLWDAQTHTYDVDSEGEWDKTTAEITVTNHSNVSVFVKMEYIPAEETGTNVSLSNSSGVLDAGKEGDFAGADSITATLNISGKPNSTDYFGGAKIGTVKIIVG